MHATTSRAGSIPPHTGLPTSGVRILRPSGKKGDHREKNIRIKKYQGKRIKASLFLNLHNQIFARVYFSLAERRCAPDLQTKRPRSPWSPLGAEGAGWGPERPTLFRFEWSIRANIPLEAYRFVPTYLFNF